MIFRRMVSSRVPWFLSSLQNTWEEGKRSFQKPARDYLYTGSWPLAVRCTDLFQSTISDQPNFHTCFLTKSHHSRVWLDKNLFPKLAPWANTREQLETIVFFGPKNNFFNSMASCNPWADFLRNDLPNLTTFSIKKLRILAKRAHVSAGGGKSDLASRLLEFASMKKPPEWYLQQKASKDRKIEIREEARVCHMNVGQILHLTFRSGKMYGRDAQVEEREPENCTLVTVRNSRNPPLGKYSNGKHVVKVSALCPGTAYLVYFQRGPTNDWFSTKRVRLVIK